MISSKDLRQKYIDFYKSKGHAEIPSASLIPENDPSTLFTTAGMQPIVPFLLGEKHPAGKRLVNSQKCIRTGDIDEVGDKVHHTFFEMLGHWSLGDHASPDGIGGGGYFKKEAIEMTYEFVTETLKLNKEQLAVSVFKGDDNAPFDQEAFDTWQKLGFSEKRIAKLGKKDNWWELGGSTGPCGPDTEMFCWTGQEPVPDIFDPENKNWVEIGNDVLMQYEKKGENKYESAKQKNIDNGTGLERLTAVLNGLDDNYKTDLFLPIIEKIEELSGKKYGDDEDVTRSMRIIADHIRAATFIMTEDAGVVPSNIDQGYVVRKLIRRAIRHGRMIGIKENFTIQIAQKVIQIMKGVYLELEKNKNFILDNIALEEEKFTKTLQQGIREFNKLAENLTASQQLSGKQTFDLFQTYGFPFELTQEMATEKGLTVDEDGFNEEFKKHQELSRTAAAGKFKGGLANQSDKTTQLHTAAHLMLAALRKVLGDHINQRGSNITDERLRFDFNHSEKMTDEQKKQVEDLVNGWIQADLPVVCQEISLDEAKQAGATGVFEHKYGDQVKVYTVGNDQLMVSKEICGGPHVERTSQLGHFRIKKEESSSAGIRRIKAVLE